MPKYEEERSFDYSADQIFDLIIDIKRYPEFLPWCLATRINDEGEDFVNANLVIGYQLHRDEFRSHVKFKRPHEIEIEYQDGPMKYLNNKWVFTPSEDGKSCNVKFFVDFEFKSPILAALMSRFFDKLVKDMIGAFEKRANELYG